MRQTGESITVLIEVNIAPNYGDGYDRIARRISQYEQVDSLYLMTGTNDLLIEMTAQSMQEAAEFVYEHLATIAGVEGTETRVVMKKYKEMGVELFKKTDQEERIKFV